jgi:predicted permease
VNTGLILLSALANLRQDIRFSSRILLKNRAFTLAAVMTLALGIGANTAVFTLVNALLLRPLPFDEPDRLLWISNSNLSGEGIPGLTGQANFRDWCNLNQTCEALGAWLPSFSDRIGLTLTGHGEPVRLKAGVVSQNLLRVLGVHPRLGRNFVDEECRRNGPNAIILSDRFWKARCQADPTIVGRTLTLNNVAWTVVGVLPASFDFSSVFAPGSTAVDFLRPYQPVAGLDHWGNILAVIGRLKPGETVQRAQSEFKLLNMQLSSAHPERGIFGASLRPLREHVSGQIRRPLVILGCAVGAVLLIACVNLSNLLLSKAAARRKEIAVRIAMGAGPGRLMRQLLTESALLSMCGALLALPLAYLATHAMRQDRGLSLPLLETVQVDRSVLVFTIAIAVLAGLISGMVPALQLAAANIDSDLKQASRGSSQGLQTAWTRQALVISEVALAFVLLVGAGLLIRSFVRLLAVDPGFRAEHAAACPLNTNLHFANYALESAFYEEVLRRIEAIPGVKSATLSDKLPLDINDLIKAHPEGKGPLQDQTPTVFAEMVDQAYFSTLRIPLLAGRDFTSRDPNFDWQNPSEKLVIINHRMARDFWPASNPLGQVVLLDNPPEPSARCRIIGVVGDVRQSALEQGAGPEIYLVNRGHGKLIVRAEQTLSSVIPEVRAVLHQLDPDMAVGEFKPLLQILDQAVAPKRLMTLLLGVFSLLGLLLASIGIYGVIACTVGQRTQEIGIRLALGSSAGAVLWLIIKQGARLAFIGCGIGLLGSLALTRGMQALLFEVHLLDWPTLAASGLLVLAVALVACALPARRAARVDPIVALRCQ